MKVKVRTIDGEMDEFHYAKQPAWGVNLVSITVPGTYDIDEHEIVYVLKNVISVCCYEDAAED